MTDKQIVKYGLTEAKISEMAALYMDLTVEDFEDEKGYAEVELARKAVKGKRVAIEKQRKVFKADAISYGKMVDSKAKEIVALLDPIESHLISEGDKVRNELARIKAEEEAKEKAKVQDRIDSLLELGINMEYFTVATMGDEDFNTFYTTARTNFEAEQSRIAAEEKAKEEAEAAAHLAAEKEAERLAEVAKQQEAERAELDRIRQEIEAGKQAIADAARRHQDKIDAEKKAAQDAKDQAELKERLAAEAKAQAEKDAAAEAERALEAEKQAKVEAERAEKLKPDKEKLIAWANELLDIITPELNSVEANNLAGQTQAYIYRVAKDLIQTAERL